MTTLKQFLHDKSNKSEVDKYFEDQAKLVLEKRKLEVIDNFNDYFDFLNNEFPCHVYYQGLIYRSVSHAYQAARSPHQHIREKIVLADSLEELYDLAGKIEDPPNWQNDRLRTMEKLLRDKFRRNRDLRDKLKATGTRELINTYWENTISNVFWGVVEGKGQNQLGRLLQSIRQDIRDNVEIDKWLFSVFDLQNDKDFLPLITLEIMKGDQALQKMPLAGKAYYMMGKLKTADVVMEHPSLSRNHACLIVDEEKGVCLVDLGSKSGCYVDTRRIDVGVPVPVKKGQKLNFGSSTRKYTIDIDFSLVEKNIDLRKKQIEKELHGVEAAHQAGTTAQLFKSKQPDLMEDTLFVGNVPQTATKEEIKKLFSKYGEVKDIRIPIDRATGEQKKICFVTFKEAADCKKALTSLRVGLKIEDNLLKISAAKRQERDDDRPDRSKLARDSKKYEERGKEDIERRYSKRDDDRRGDRDRKRSRRDSRDRKNGSDKKNKRKDNEKERERSDSARGKRSDSNEKKKGKRKKSRSRSAEKKDKSRKEEKENKKESKRDSKLEAPKQEDVGKREGKAKNKSRSRSSSSPDSQVKKRKKRSASSTPEKKRRDDKKKARKRSRSRSSSKERRRSPKQLEDKKKNSKKEEEKKKVEKEEKGESSDSSDSSSSDDSDSSASD